MMIAIPKETNKPGWYPDCDHFIGIDKSELKRRITQAGYEWDLFIFYKLND